MTSTHFIMHYSMFRLETLELNKSLPFSSQDISSALTVIDGCVYICISTEWADLKWAAERADFLLL